MIAISLKDTGALLGHVGEADLKILVDQFEEEGPADRDYFVNDDSLALLVEAGISPDFATLLRSAIAGGEGIDIAWSRA